MVMSLQIAVQRRPRGVTSVKYSPKEGEEINHWLLEEEGTANAKALR